MGDKEKKNIDKHNIYKKIQKNKFLCITIIVFIIALIFLMIPPQMKIPRYNHSAVVLEDGRIFISGGETIIKGIPVVLDSAEIYDPHTRKSILIKDKMKQKRTTHASILLPSGDVLIIGGDGKKKTSEIYRIKTNSFENAANLNYIRQNVTAVLYKKNNILIVDTFSPNIELYDVDKNEYKVIGSFKKNLYSANEYVNINGKLFFPIKKIDLSMDSEITTINYFDTNKNIIGEIKKKNNGVKDSIYIDCQYNTICENNNKLIQFCSTNQYIYAENYNFKKQIFENASNKLRIFGINDLYPIIKGSNILILGNFHSKKFNAKEIEILYNVNNNKIYFLKNNRINKKSKILTTKEKTYIIGGYYEIPLIGLNFASKKIEVLK